MNLLLTMLPFYLLGNFHCIGMCGPLVMMLGKHNYRWFYFLGRLLSFSLAGLFAGGLGAVLQGILNIYHVGAFASFIFGFLILYIGIRTFEKKQSIHFFSKMLKPFNESLSLLLFRDAPFATFLFGFFTIALPCGQTIIVFSACALAGSAWVGALNGFAFALLTSPSLWLAMQSHVMLSKAKVWYQPVIGSLAIMIGILGICRGFAEFGLIPHFGVHPFILF